MFHAWPHKCPLLPLWLVILVALLLITGCGPSTSSAPLPATPGSSPSPEIASLDKLVPTTGCGKTPPSQAGTSTLEVLTSGGMSRSYLVHVPSGYRSSTPTALVLIFHGASSRNSPVVLTEMEQDTHFSSLADQYNFIAVYPHSTVNPSGDVSWDTDTVAGATMNVRFVSDLLNSLQATFCIDAHRIYATGHSSGGGMTNVLACTLARRIAAFAPVSGAFFLTPAGCNPARAVPILEFHGTDDPKVPYTGSPGVYPAIADWLQTWVTRDGCTVGPSVFFQKDDVTGERWTHCHAGVVVMHYRIEQGGHGWPGDPTPGRGATQTIQAAPLIWQFFQRSTLP